MRLALKIFLATLVVLLVLIEVAVWSLVAVNRLVHANQQIVNEIVPALEQLASLDEDVAAMKRFRARWAALQQSPREEDAAEYERAWLKKARDVEDDLDTLSHTAVAPAARREVGEIREAFDHYRSVTTETAGGETRFRIPEDPLDRAAIAGVERVQAALDAFSAASREGAELSKRRAAALETRTWRTVMLALPVSVVLALALSAFIALRMTRALRRLAAASAQVAQGSFDQPVPIDSDDEIGELARAFNRMATQLAEVDRMKEQLFAHISHELRTPLTSIREATHLLAERAGGPLAPRQARLVEIVGNSTDRLLRLVNRILDLSRLRAGMLPLDRRPVRLHGVTARALLELRPQADARHVTLLRHGDGTDATVLGDEERLVEVLVNLLSNAIRATPEGGTVRVAVTPERDAVALTVEDTGVGIAPDTLPRVFDPYVQGPVSRGGAGLGLAIVKGIVEAHGGEIQASSEPGRGSRFVIRLPRDEGHA